MLLSNSNSDSDASHTASRSRQHRAAGGLPVASLEAFEEKLAESVRAAIAESPWLAGCLTG